MKEFALNKLWYDLFLRNSLILISHSSEAGTHVRSIDNSKRVDIPMKISFFLLITLM